MASAATADRSVVRGCGRSTTPAAACKPVWAPQGAWRRTRPQGGRTAIISYLVDPASSHMLVSKIKPCMSKYKPLYGETANGSLNQL